jgi:hypothetical protein
MEFLKRDVIGYDEDKPEMIISDVHFMVMKSAMVIFRRYIWICLNLHRENRGK